MSLLITFLDMNCPIVSSHNIVDLKVLFLMSCIFCSNMSSQCNFLTKNKMAPIGIKRTKSSNKYGISSKYNRPATQVFCRYLSLLMGQLVLLSIIHNI